MGKQERSWEHLLAAAHPGTLLQRFHLGMGQHHCFCLAPVRVVGQFLGRRTRPPSCHHLPSQVLRLSLERMKVLLFGSWESSPSTLLFHQGATRSVYWPEKGWGGRAPRCFLGQPGHLVSGLALKTSDGADFPRPLQFFTFPYPNSLP